MIEEILTADSRHQCLVGCIMKILGLLSNSIMAGILKATFDASLTGPFITFQTSQRGSDGTKTTKSTGQINPTYHMSNAPADRRSTPASLSFFLGVVGLLHWRQTYGHSDEWHPLDDLDDLDVPDVLNVQPCLRLPVHHHYHRARRNVNGHLGRLRRA
jgi:hypothetical protein